MNANAKFLSDIGEPLASGLLELSDGSLPEIYCRAYRRYYEAVFTTAPAVKEAFEKTEYAARLKATGVILSYICPLMYMNNPLCKAMPVMTCSNKLRTYTTARFYTEDEILTKITKGV